MMVDEEKRKFMMGGPILDPLNKRANLYAIWRQERELINCSTCGYHCKAEWKADRFPPDCGGGGQCQRWIENNRYGFVNVDGSCVVIPDEIVSHIIADVLAQLPGK